ncbi:MAG: hypothetical protein AAFU73_15060 [Planctomycetota bacterium]
MASTLLLLAASLPILQGPSSTESQETRVRRAHGGEFPTLAEENETEIAGLPTSRTIGFMPRGLTSFGAAVHGGWLYVAGGYFGKPHAYSTEGQSRAFTAINLTDPRDVRLLSDIDPIQGIELVPLEGELVTVGGMRALNTADEDAELESCSCVRAFDPETEEWRRLPSLPHPRSSHRAVALGGRLYVVGGWTLGADGRDWAETMHVLDPSAPEPAWRSIEVPFRARALAACSLGGRLVVTGGITPKSGVSSETWIFDPFVETWTQGPDFPDWGFGLSSTEMEGGAFCAGSSGQVYALPSADAEEWQLRGTLRHGRIFHELRAEGPDSLVALGGIVGMGTAGRVRQVERLELNAIANEPVIEHFAVPAPADAKSRYGLMVESRSALLFGGNRGMAQHGFDADAFSSSAWRFDFGTMKWTALDALPSARQSMQVLRAEGTPVGIVAGGFAPGAEGTAAASQSGTWIYDVEFGDWKAGPSLPAGRSQFGLVAHDGRAYAFGGSDYDPSRARAERFVLHTNVLSAPLGGDTDEMVFEPTDIELPRARRAFASVAHEGKIYMVGGLGDGFEPVEPFDVLDLDTGAWSEAPAPPRARVGGDLVAIGDALYLACGSEETDDGLEASRRVLRFDPEANVWDVVVEDVGFDTKHARAFELDGRLYVFTLHREGAGRAEYAVIDVARAQG